MLSLPGVFVFKELHGFLLQLIKGSQLLAQEMQKLDKYIAAIVMQSRPSAIQVTVINPAV